jgi:glyoxylase-like metal-dependent hydrolase (beta-lactamase superfamily II)
LPKAVPSEDGVYELYAMCYARAPKRRVHENFLRRDMHDGPMPLDFSIWIARNSHRTIIIDTGFGSSAAFERHLPLSLDPVLALGHLGIDPDEIEDVILTHLHFDHAGNLGRFAKARFHVQQSEVAFATGPCMCEAHLRFPFDVEDVVTFVRHTYAERVRFYDGDAAPFPGVTLHVLPGHSMGIQAVRVMTSRGPVLLASDVSHLYANFLRRAPYALTVDAAATLRSYAKLLELAGSVDRIIPGHDPKVRDLYPCRSFGYIELAVLHEEPRQYAVEELMRLEQFEDPSLTEHNLPGDNDIDDLSSRSIVVP